MAAAPRILLALDYGTTYTGKGYHPAPCRPPAHQCARKGVAFCSTADLNENNWYRNIQIVSQWPTDKNEDKVPSSISYTPRRLGRKQFGYDIEPGSDVIMHTKLEFQPKSRSKEIEVLANTLDGLVLSNHNKNPAARRRVERYYAKSAVDVCRDYLDRIAEVVLESLKQKFNEFTASVVPIDMMITHPAVCSL